MNTDVRHASLEVTRNENGEFIEAELYLIVKGKWVAKQNILNTSINEFAQRHKERFNDNEYFTVFTSENTDACDDYEGGQEQGLLVDKELFDQAKADCDAGIIVTPQNQHFFYFDEIKTAIYSKDETKIFIPQAPNNDVLESTSTLVDFFQTDPDAVPEQIRSEPEQTMREEAHETSISVLDTLTPSLQWSQKTR